MSETAYSPATPASDIVDVIGPPELKAPGHDNASRTLFRVSSPG
ncbi:hypothetical protein [Edaphobacter bradus]|nr:hypothetical protein [Edaphobacter bradus]